MVLTYIITYIIEKICEYVCTHHDHVMSDNVITYSQFVLQSLNIINHYYKLYYTL